MTQYLLSVSPLVLGRDAASPTRSRPPTPTWMPSTSSCRAPASWVFGGGLEAPDTATVVSVNDGQPMLSDGPYAESKEHLGGFWVIDAADLDAALRWAEEAARACRAPVEFRPFQAEPESAEG